MEHYKWPFYVASALLGGACPSVYFAMRWARLGYPESMVRRPFIVTLTCIVLAIAFMIYGVEHAQPKGGE